MRRVRGLSFLRRIIIFCAALISLGLAVARPVSAVVLPPNETRDGEIVLSLDSNAFTDAMRIYLRYPTKVYYGTNYVTLEIVMSGFVGNVAYARPAVQYLVVDGSRYGTDSISDTANWLTADAAWDEPIPSDFGYYSYSSSIYFNVPISITPTSGSVSLYIASIVVPYTVMSFNGFLIEGWERGDGPIYADWDETISISGVDVISDYDRGYMDGRAAAWDELRDIVYNDGYQAGYAVGKKDGIKIGTSDNPIYKYYDDKVVLPSGVRDEIINVDGINQLHDNVSSIIAADYLIEIDTDAYYIYAILRMPGDYKINTALKVSEVYAKYEVEANYYWNERKCEVWLPKTTFDSTDKVTAALQEIIVYYELADEYKSVYYMTDYDKARDAGYKDGYDDGVRDASAVTKEGAFSWVGDLLSNTAGKFLRIELWPGVTIGLLVGIPFAITLVAFVVGLLQGRKND